MTEGKRLVAVFNDLTRRYGEVTGFLEHRNPFELLIAVILSAQTTDRGVNRITPLLFSRYPTPAKLAAAEIADLEEIVRPTGYFRMKSRNIRETGRLLSERFGGRVPEEMEELVSLPGVGRKTANVIRGALFGKPAIIVDTHFKRVTTRLGFAHERDPERIERELAGIIPPALQYRFSMVVNKHGRECCHARAPACAACSVERHCPWPAEHGGAGTSSIAHGPST